MPYGLAVLALVVAALGWRLWRLERAHAATDARLDAAELAHHELTAVVNAIQPHAGPSPDQQRERVAAKLREKFPGMKPDQLERAVDQMLAVAPTRLPA